jgi:hypothetical protein
VIGLSTKAVFEAYIERLLCPILLSKGQMVVMDNLAAHEGEWVKELNRAARCCKLLYLTAYSHQISILSRKRSPRSRASCEKPRPGAERDADEGDG